MMIRRYEIAGLEVEIRMADGMERLIPVQFEEFRVGGFRANEGWASIPVGGSENRNPDRASSLTPICRMKHDKARIITKKLDRNDGASIPVGGSENRNPDQSEYGGQAVDVGELLDDTANDMGRVRLFRLGSGEYLVRLTDLRGSDFEMIASEDFSRCSIRSEMGERIEFRVGEWSRAIEDRRKAQLCVPTMSSRTSIPVGGSENRNPDRESSESQSGVFSVGGSENRDPDRASRTGRAIAQSLQADREAVSSLIRIAFSQAVLLHGGVSIHASAVVSNGEGYLFLGASGTGKSTHSQLWIKNIPDTELLNDDNPILRLMPDGTVRVFGSPWSGKTPCYRQASAPLHGIVRLEQAPVNEFRRVTDVDAFAMLLPSCSAIKTSALLHNALCETLIVLSEMISTGVLRCRPDGEAAIVCRERVGEFRV